MKPAAWYCLLVLAVHIGAAQSVTFSGTVVDSTVNTVLERASVYIVEHQRHLATERDGSFHTELPPGAVTVIVRLLGYQDQTHRIVLDRDLHRVFRLTPSDIQMNEVNVEGRVDRSGLTASSQSVTVMTPQEVDRHRGQTIGKALESITGVTVLSTGPSIAKPVIRGLHSQRVKVLNAGVPQEGQQWGGEHAPEIDPFAPSKIEVLKGVAGVEFGAGAIGGVIKLQPREMRRSTGIGGELSLNTFTNNRQGALSLLVEGGPDLLSGLSWRVQGSGRKAGSASAPGYVIGNSGFTEADGSAAVGYMTDVLSVEAYYSHFGTTLGIYSGSHLGNLDDLNRALAAGGPLTEYSFTYDIQPPKQEITHDLWSVRTSYVLPGAGTIEAQYGWQSNGRQEYDGHARSRGKANFDLTLTSYSGDVKFVHTPIGGLYGTIGISAMRQGNVAQGLSFLIPNFRSHSGGIYLLESYSEQLLTLSAGGRFDVQSLEVYANPQRGIAQTQHDYTSASGAVGAIYQFQPEWSVNVNAGTGWRPPTVNELYSFGVHHGTAQFEIGDKTLVPERSFSLDLTLKHRAERSSAEIGLFLNRMEDFIFAFPSPQPTLTLRGIFPTMLYRQTDVLMRGVDASADLEVADDVRLGASLSMVIADDVVRNEPLYQMPSDRARLWMHYHLPRHLGAEESYLELTATAVTRQTRVPVNADYLPPPAGYMLFDLEYGIEFIMGPHLVRCNVSVQNIFNTAYRDYLSRFRYFIDNPGRDIVLRVHLPFGIGTEPH
ncbi:MAG: TonB-dependent receptor [Bacteroidetes bacterium]|nr:TonB-dependent receptor [Bacteroidota bacterium]